MVATFNRVGGPIIFFSQTENSCVYNFTVPMRHWKVMCKIGKCMPAAYCNILFWWSRILYLAHIMQIHVHTKISNFCYTLQNFVTCLIYSKLLTISSCMISGLWIPMLIKATYFHDCVPHYRLIFNMRGPSYPRLNRSVWWLLMPWLVAPSGHQQPWYWLCKLGRFLS